MDSGKLRTDKEQDASLTRKISADNGPPDFSGLQESIIEDLA